jgi:hypothetical protein
VPLFGALVAAVLGFCGWLVFRDHQPAAVEETAEYDDRRYAAPFRRQRAPVSPHSPRRPLL